MAKPSATNPRKLASQERTKITVEAILDAAAHVSVHEGYARTSTNRIAVAAGVSIVSLHQYFPNKEPLVARHKREILAILENAIQECALEDLNSAMSELIRAMIAVQTVDPSLHCILKEEVPRIGNARRGGSHSKGYASSPSALSGKMQGRHSAQRPRYSCVHLRNCSRDIAPCHRPQ